MRSGYDIRLRTGIGRRRTARQRMHRHSFPLQIDTLRRRLRAPLPGMQAHESMAPRRPGVREALRIDDKPCRNAAVMALLLPHGPETSILLTRRPDTLNDHAGQIAFPGGRTEPGESLLDTALRETHEEAGVDPGRIDVLGPLSPLYISVSNYCVYPFAGALAEPPRELVPCSDEVERIFTVPLSLLADPSNRRIERWTIRGVPVDVPFFDVDGEVVWGATAMMLAELLALMEAS